MASPLLCDDSCRAAAADPSGGSSSSGKRRRRCFSSMPLQPAAVPPSPFSSPAAERLEETAEPEPSSRARRSSSPCSTRAACSRPSDSPAAAAAAARAACAVRATFSSVEEEDERLQPSSRRREHQHQRTVGTGAGNRAGSRARGLLSRVTTAAVAAAALAVSAPVVGVGALMTEEQCKGATRRGTAAELMESPRPDTVTEAAAAGIDRTIVASQVTYDRMLLDQASITLEEGLDVPFRNLWSDHVWLKTAKVTFTDVPTLGLFMEGSPPEFNCMNEHYGLSFELGSAVSTTVDGTLRADKVLNWDLLGPDYLELDGLDTFVPTDVLTVTSTTSLVAARENTIREEFGADFSEETMPMFHYFLSVPAEDVDPSGCPEPCTGEVVTYYWSESAGTVYRLDRAAAVAETQPCWLELFQAVADGPPAGGVDNAVWEATGACTAGLFEDAIRSGEGSSAGGAAASANTGAVGGDDDDGGGGAAVAAAVLIPALLVTFAVVAFGLLRHQKVQRLKKMKTTDEAWGEGLDGSGGGSKPRPPTGRFKLGAATAAVAGGGDGGAEGGILRLKSFPPPQRVFTDVSIDDQDGGVGVVTAAGETRRDEEEGRVSQDEDGEDMIYPM